jgi:tRNA G46 methylase TrmB
MRNWNNKKEDNTAMSDSQQPHKYKHPSTYIVQDRQSEKELRRLTIQDQLTTKIMGGVLPEQDNPLAFQHILDIGCGTGNWAIQTARTYPTISLAGIDISKPMIEHARAQAAVQQVADRTEFRVMDALLILEFPSNIRYGQSSLWCELCTHVGVAEDAQRDATRFAARGCGARHRCGACT